MLPDGDERRYTGRLFSVRARGFGPKDDKPFMFAIVFVNLEILIVPEKAYPSLLTGPVSSGL